MLQTSDGQVVSWRDWRKKDNSRNKSSLDWQTGSYESLFGYPCILAAIRRRKWPKICILFSLVQVKAKFIKLALSLTSFDKGICISLKYYNTWSLR